MITIKQAERWRNWPIYNVLDAQGQSVAVHARSEFEARMWATNKAPEHKPLCSLPTPNQPHMGPTHSCGRCYVHCQCPPLGVPNGEVI